MAEEVEEQTDDIAHYHMMIVDHGGQCCGIKHIYNMGDDPNREPPTGLLFKHIQAIHPPSLKATKSMGTFASRDYVGAKADSHKNCFVGAAPRETPRQRLERYIEALKEHRPGHLVEVTINSNQWRWEPVLEELGFKLVSTFYNSNSSMTVKVYHLTLKDGAIVK